jgi:hypothetical protein
MSNNKLKMTFTPNTIEHLGVRLYSTIPPVIAELIANSYDADAKKVTVIMNDTDPDNKEIMVEDNGHGMTFNEINAKFLRIGRNRRQGDSDEEQKSPKDRLVIGKKGLGKLSFFGIAQKIEISTTKDGVRNIFELDWNDIISQDNKEESADYEPKIIEQDMVDKNKTHGTTITLKSIKRVSDFNADSLAVSMSRFFIIDKEMDIFIQHNQDKPVQVRNEMKYESLDAEITWEIPGGLIGFDSDYNNKNKITGKLFSTKKPIPPSTNMRGITLFSRKKLVNNPEYFSESTSSHFFSYLTGWLEVDFIVELSDDVIQTNRQSVKWDDLDMEKLHEYLQQMIKWLEKDWRKRRVENQTKKLSDETGINLKKWADTMPDKIRPDFNKLLGILRRDVDLPDKEEKVIKSVRLINGMLPEYPELHWRYLHPTLKSTIEDCYKKQEYYTAVFEGAKKYISEVQNKTKSELKDWELLENIYAMEKLGNGMESPKRWTVVRKYRKTDNTDFDYETKLNISKGHRGLVLAMWQAFRDPISHEVVNELKDSGLYTERDCLDALSLLSHLFRRLDDIQSVTTAASH